jgi:hypothetical protein
VFYSLNSNFQNFIFILVCIGNMENNKLIEARKKREERKLARQKQMEAKRAAKIFHNDPVKKL